MINFFTVNAFLDIALIPFTIIAIMNVVDLSKETDSCALQEEKQQEPEIYEYKSYTDTVLIDYDKMTVKFADMFGVRYICFESIYNILVKDDVAKVMYYNNGNKCYHYILLKDCTQKKIKNANKELIGRIDRIIENNNSNPAKNVTSTPLQTKTSH